LRYLIIALVTAASLSLNAEWRGPPRFDGAGYAVLGLSLKSGRGYREISHPASPRHDHFPPGYPTALALLWCVTGRSVLAAHIFSGLCTFIAVLLASLLFERIMLSMQFFLLGLALALNWTWSRNGTSIQSEPLFFIAELAVVLIAQRVQKENDWRFGILMGAVLGLSTLIRHVGACLAIAVALDLALRKKWRLLSSTLMTASLMVAPWLIWLVIVGHHSQFSLLSARALPQRIMGQAMFYLERLPDQITGPIVELGTQPGRGVSTKFLVIVWALIISSLMIFGWVRALRSIQLRLFGLVPLITIALLLVWPFTEAGRFLIPLVPFLLLGLVGGIIGIGELLNLAPLRFHSGLIALILSVPYSGYAIMNGRAAAARTQHADFDAACAWLKEQTTERGSVLSHHPGEVFWQTGWPALEVASSDANAIDRLIDRFGVAYLLIDENRYANAAQSPLSNYVAAFPERVVVVWASFRGSQSVRVLKTLKTREGVRSE
jgi:hypothetical protein